MEISQKFLDKYNLLYGTLFNNYLRVTEKSNLRSAQKELGALAFQGYASACPEEAAKYDARNLPETVEDNAFKIQLFLVLAGLNSYYGLCNLDHLARKEGEDAHFGYAGAFDTLKGYCVLHSKNNKEFTDATLSRLESTLRSCSFSEYVEKGYYEKDIDWVSNLMQSSAKLTGTQDELAAIEDNFGKQVESEVDKIIAAYSEILSASFGLEKYVGVFTFDKASPVMGMNSSYVSKSIEPASEFAEYYNPILADAVFAITPQEGVHCQDGSIYHYSDRQFDHRAIFEGYSSSANKPIYFPAKVLEIATLAKWTRGTHANVYAGCTNNENKNLQSYLKYIREEFELNIYDFCVYLCKIFIKQAKQAGNEGIEMSDLESILDDKDSALRKSMLGFVEPVLSYYTKCVTTAVILMELTTEKKKGRFGRDRVNILGFRIRVFSANALQSNVYFCKQLSMLVYKDENTMVGVENTDVHPCGHGFIGDYAYTFNADKVYARPIFAYKALDAMKAQGRELSWKNILLGKYADGSLCTSGEGSKIHLQSTNLHSIYAGSRSGKGVMGFNIFATAIASGLPIFYFDRKPDTAVVMSKLCPNMFAVNGGQYSSGMDLENAFNPAEITIKIPAYLDEYLGKTEVACDYAYFRGYMLFWCLVNFAEELKGKDARADRIASILSGGAVVVLDEFTNYTKYFLQEKPVVGGSGWFSANECYSAMGISDFANKISAIATSANKGQASKDEATRTAASVTAKNKVASLKESFKLSALYFAQVADMYKECLAAGPKWFRSGGTFSKAVQLFVIGQEIPAEFYDSNEEFKTSTSSRGKFNASRHKSGNSEYPDIPWLASIKKMGGDFIFGYQPSNKGGRPEYLAQKEKGTITSQMLTASRRCFCYYNPGKGLSYDELQQITNTRRAFNSTAAMNEFLNKMVYFKPFLILNNANEPPVDVREPDGTTVSEELANKRAGVGDTSGAYLSSQYVGQCLTSCNNAGLTWDDLLADNDDGMGHLRSEIGFEGYIRGLCGTVPTDKMGASGVAMNILVQEVFGYRGTWKDFLFDFTPEALFTPQMFVDAAINPSVNTVAHRLSKSFFSSSLVNTSSFGEFSFAEVYKNELGSLYPYYADASAEEAVARDKTVTSAYTSDLGNLETVSDEETVMPTADDFAAQAAKMSQNMGSSSENNAGEGSEEITFDFIFDNISKSLAIVKQHPKYASLLKRKGGEQRVAYALATIIATKMGISH